MNKKTDKIFLTIEVMGVILWWILVFLGLVKMVFGNRFEGFVQAALSLIISQLIVLNLTKKYKK